MTLERFLGIVRALMTAVGGYLVSTGMIDDATATEVTGAVVVIAGAVWSVVSKPAALV